MAKNILNHGQVFNKKGELEKFEEDSYDTICLYFSAEWCPPCRNFTPVLNEAYKKAIEKDTKVKIVFVSHDKDERQCQDYYKKMDFSILEYNSSMRQSLKNQFKVSGIPS